MALHWRCAFQNSDLWECLKNIWTDMDVVICSKLQYKPPLQKPLKNDCLKICGHNVLVWYLDLFNRTQSKYICREPLHVCWMNGNGKKWKLNNPMRKPDYNQTHCSDYNSHKSVIRANIFKHPPWKLNFKSNLKGHWKKQICKKVK